MTPNQEAHLLSIKQVFDAAVDRKYRAGQAEHGGNLWDVTTIGLLDAAIDEAVDQIVYLITLRGAVVKLRQDLDSGARSEVQSLHPPPPPDR